MMLYSSAKYQDNHIGFSFSPDFQKQVAFVFRAKQMVYFGNAHFLCRLQTNGQDLIIDFQAGIVCGGSGGDIGDEIATINGASGTRAHHPPVVFRSEVRGEGKECASTERKRLTSE